MKKNILLALIIAALPLTAFSQREPGVLGRPGQVITEQPPRKTSEGNWYLAGSWDQGLGLKGCIYRKHEGWCQGRNCWTKTYTEMYNFYICPSVKPN